MKVHIIAILFFGLIQQAFTQIYVIDSGDGLFKDLKLAVTAIALIEKGDPEMILDFYENQVDAELKKLRKESDFVSKKFGYDEKSSPMFFYQDSNDNTFYERTYFEYNKKTKKIKYLYQISVNLKKKGNELYISGIEFRKKSKIVSRDKEVNSIFNRNRNDPPPAPPGPPPFR